MENFDKNLKKWCKVRNPNRSCRAQGYGSNRTAKYIRQIADPKTNTETRRVMLATLKTKLDKEIYSNRDEDKEESQDNGATDQMEEKWQSIHHIPDPEERSTKNTQHTNYILWDSGKEIRI